MSMENLYRKKCKEIAKAYNFKTYKNAFYRVTNDVFQSFNFHKSVSGSECTVEFSVHPLCVEYDIKKDVEYFLYDKFCMALKTGNYDVALAHIFNVKKRSAFAFEQNKKSYGDNISPDYIAKMEKKQLKYDSIILMLQRNETEKIQDFIYINETRNLNNLGYSLYD